MNPPEPGRRERGMMDFLGLLGPGWNYMRHDEMVAWSWKRIRIWGLIFIFIGLYLVALDYMITFFLEPLLEINAYLLIFFFAFLSCICLVYYFLFCIYALFMYPLQMYRRSFLNNTDMKSVPLTFRDRYAIVMVPFAYIYLVVSVIGMVSVIFSSEYLHAWLYPDYVSEFRVLRMSVLDYLVSVALGTIASLVTLITALSIAQGTMLLAHATTSFPIRLYGRILYPAVPWILHGAIGVAFTTGRQMGAFNDPRHIALYLVLYAVILVIILRWASRLYFKGVEVIRRECFQTED